MYVRLSTLRSGPDRTTGPSGSGCTSFVAMVQAANLRKAMTVLRALHQPRERGVFQQRQMPT